MTLKAPKAVAIVSGGLDSITMLDVLRYFNIQTISAVSFNYGQRHKKELEFARARCEELHIPHQTIDLWSSGFTNAIASSGSSLVSDMPVPEGHYAEDSMKQTVVPNRNMVMIAIAGSIAVAQGADYVATGVHSGDHFIYPDCRPGFINSMTEALYKGNEGFGNLRGVFAPFMTSTKADIAMWALKLGTPIEKTWSCYNGGEIHCGKCGTCVERLEAIHQAIQALTGAEDYLKQTSDLTKYEDSEYWKTVTA